MMTATDSPYVLPAPLPIWKRAIDLAFCAALLPLLVVLTLGMWIAGGCSLQAPVFFRQERVGYLGRRFRIFKIRTMYPGAETSTHQAHLSELIRSNAPMQKMDARRDPRLIPGAWLIRASGLDELPQILNVLRGEMTLIGPRPCLGYEYDEYLPWQRARFRSVPGLTGLWQVSGKNRTTFAEMIRLDIQYTEQMSLLLDLKILLLTVPALLAQIGDTRRARQGSTRSSQPIATARTAIRTIAHHTWPSAPDASQLVARLETQNSTNP